MEPPNPSDLTGRVAVVTGGTKNIGLAAATALVRAGADVAVFARSKDRTDGVTKELNALGRGRAISVQGNVTSVDDILRLAEVLLDTFGGVDIVVNNAYVEMGRAPTLDTPEEEWIRGLRGYVTGPLELIRRCRSSMVERGHGSVVNLVSTAGFTPIAGLGGYGIMKAAMWTTTRYLARELAPGVRVNAVCPGTTSEDGVIQDQSLWSQLIKAVPLNRMGGPDETAQAVLFLASDASSYTTGQVLFVEGGRVTLNGTAV